MSHNKITVPLDSARDESLCAVLLMAQFLGPKQRLLKSSL